MRTHNMALYICRVRILQPTRQRRRIYDTRANRTDSQIAEVMQTVLRSVIACHTYICNVIIRETSLSGAISDTEYKMLYIHISHDDVQAKRSRCF